MRSMYKSGIFLLTSPDRHGLCGRCGLGYDVRFA
jgi:hypothetical protein